MKTDVAAALERAWWSVPRGCFTGHVVTILCGGPSLTPAKVDLCRQHGHVLIAINRAYELAPDAAWLWGADPGWFWTYNSGEHLQTGWSDALEHRGTKIMTVSTVLRERIAAHMAQVPRLVEGGVRAIKHVGRVPGFQGGVSDDPGMVRGNNAAQSILSVLHFARPERIIMLGLDMNEPRHWHEGYPGIPHARYETDCVPHFRTLVEPYRRMRIEVLNANPESAVDAFQRVKLEDAV